MALQLPHSQFFHIPRTGGFWVRRACSRGGIPLNEICQVHNNYFVEPGSFLIKRGTILHMRPFELNKQGFKRFTFVRHPINWLESYFHFKMQYGWNPEKHDIDLKCRTENFEEFINLYLKHLPGYYSKIIHMYDNVDFVGRTETMALDLVAILKRCGEEFDKQKVLETPPYNTTKKVARIPKLPKKVQDKVLKAEEYVISKYYADGLI